MSSYRRGQLTRSERLGMQGKTWNGCEEWCGGSVPALATEPAWLEFVVLRIPPYRRKGEAVRREITLNPGLLGFAFLGFAFDLSI